MLVSNKNNCGKIKKPISSDSKSLFAAWFDTQLGPILTVVDEEYLYLVEFIDSKGLEKKIESLRKRLKVEIIPGKTDITDQIETELKDYFDGKSYIFNTPYFLLGSFFQRSVWNALLSIPKGQTRSYLDIAKSIGNEKAFRAVANANGRNQLALIIPCHRVINETGALGGYAGGISRKQWLIDHERRY